MRAFVQFADSVGATIKKLEKLRLIGEFLRSLPPADAALAARFFSAHVFPKNDERTLGVGSANLSRVIAEYAGKAGENLAASYRKHGDLGDMAEELLRNTNPEGDLSFLEVARLFENLAAARGPAQKSELLANAFQRASAGDVRYIVKIITGDLRIGSKESLVEEAIAKAFDQPLAAVRRANMLTGDIGETLTLAANNQLTGATMRLFHPLGFMLAASAETPADLFDEVESNIEVPSLLVEEKYDGIRAQVHKDNSGKVRLFSRTLDEITEFPELLQPIGKLPGEFILDGEPRLARLPPIALHRITKTPRPQKHGHVHSKRYSREICRLRPALSRQRFAPRRTSDKTQSAPQRGLFACLRSRTRPHAHCVQHSRRRAGRLP